MNTLTSAPAGKTICKRAKQTDCAHVAGYLLVLLITTILTYPVLALVQPASGATPPNPPFWWQLATGILGIPALIISFIYSWVLIVKTKIETRKAEIDTTKAEYEIEKLRLDQNKLAPEIKEKQRSGKSTELSLVDRLEVSPEIITGLLDRAARTQSGLSLILRFAVLGLIQSLFSIFFINPLTIVSVVAVNLIARNLEQFAVDYEDVRSVADIVRASPSLLPIILNGIIFLVIGIPLLRDLNRYLGIEMPRIWFAGRKTDSLNKTPASEN